MAIRIKCDDPLFPDAWVDVSERWTLGEWHELDNAGWSEFLAMWRRKAVACYIPTPDGRVIESPADLTEELLESFDLVLIGFIGASLPRACAHLRNLGNVAARLSPNGREKTATTAQT